MAEGDSSPFVGEEIEGVDEKAAVGWDDYPLDSVFVRTEQRTVGDVVRRIRADRYELNPDFQRDFVWSAEKQSRLVESCLMRLPLPVFYVAEAPDGRIIVVDGLQRLSTFRRFLDNELRLTFAERDDDGKPQNPLEGKRYNDLQLSLQERIEDSQLILYVLEAKAPERAKLDIFERVNSGEPLTRQQMRNCLYNGPATQWLKAAADSDDFLSATGRSLDRKRMRDREAINRFCAFHLLGYQNYRSGDMDVFLAEALEQMNANSDDQRAELRRTFDRAMQNNFKLFGPHAFRKSILYPDGSRSVLNIAFFDVCSTLLRELDDERLQKFKDPLKEVISDLLRDDDFVYAITYSTNSRKPVWTRFEMMAAALDETVK
jgi:hypothetical protein